jgi:hypothetical protein
MARKTAEEGNMIALFGSSTLACAALSVFVFGVFGAGVLLSSLYE